MSFERLANEIHWRVAWGNHAVEFAEAHPVVRQLSSALDSLAWTRGTGGGCRYRCEYDRDESFRKQRGDGTPVTMPRARVAECPAPGRRF